MVYGYTVKKNGVLYKAGQEVPENVEEKSVESEQETTDKPVKRGRPPKTEE